MTETEVREQYNQMAAVYDRRWRAYIADTLSFLNNWVQLSPTATILDVACGTGEFERLLLNENPKQQVVGVDISDKMLAIARQKCQAYPNVEFHTASVTSLPFKSHSFDWVLSANAFHYFNEPLEALAEIKRVLKPNGRVVILDWSRDYLYCKICDLVLQIFDSAHHKCYTQAELHHLLATARFHLRRATKIRFGHVWGLMAATATPLT